MLIFFQWYFYLQYIIISPVHGPFFLIDFRIYGAYKWNFTFLLHFLILFTFLLISWFDDGMTMIFMLANFLVSYFFCDIADRFICLLISIYLPIVIIIITCDIYTFIKDRSFLHTANLFVQSNKPYPHHSSSYLKIFFAFCFLK